ncbi:MFS transporter [Rothia sp. LK2588]|uniref:MFS transporter n=1 Tax=Rothia sp. LK2588 TaxID=3114369 RepID=UPI0034D02121
MDRTRSPLKPQAWLWTLVAFGFLCQTGLNMARPQMSYKLIAFGANETVIGLVTALYALIPVFAAIAMGRLAGRTRRPRLLVGIGGGLIAIGTLVLTLAEGIPAIAAAAMVFGFGHLIFAIAGQASISRYSTDADLDRGFGWLTASISAGQLLGPLLGGLILGLNHDPAQRLNLINLALWIGTGFGLASIPLMMVKVKLKEMPALTSQIPTVTEEIPTVGQESPRVTINGQKQPVQKPTTWRILSTPGVPSNMLASLSMLAVADILTSFLPLVGERAGVSPMWVGVLLATRSASSIISRSMLTSLSRRWNRTQLVITSLLVSAVTVAVVVTPAIISHVWLAFVLMALAGFFVGIAQPLTMTMIIKSVPESWRSPALAVRLTGNRVGQVIIPLAAGVAAAPLGPSGAVWFTCALLGISGVQQVVRYAKTGPTEGDH